jgi:hypothetical protein
MRSSCYLCLCLSPFNIFVCIFVAAGTFLPSRCLATAISSGSTIPTFTRNVTLHSKVVGRGVFCAVRVLSITQYVVKGK